MDDPPVEYNVLAPDSPAYWRASPAYLVRSARPDYPYGRVDGEACAVPGSQPAAETPRHDGSDPTSQLF